MLYSFLRAFALFSDPTKLHGVVPSVDLAGNADAEAAQILSAYARAVSVLLFASGLVAGYGGNKGRSVCTGRTQPFSPSIILHSFFINYNCKQSQIRDATVQQYNSIVAEAAEACRACFAAQRQLAYLNVRRPPSCILCAGFDSEGKIAFFGSPNSLRSTANPL